MPANLPAEWFAIQKEYLEERDLEKKIELLKKLISVTPKHKGTENLLADVRKKLSRLEEQLEKKARKPGRKQASIKKSGDILVAILGLTKSGKSSLLNALTNAKAEVSSQPYTTKEPVTGVCFFEGVAIQFVEIPSFFLPKHLSIAHSADLLLVLASSEEERGEVEKIIAEHRIKKKKVFWSIERKDYNQLLKKIIEEAEVMRVFTKPVGKEKEEKALVLKKGSNLKDLVERINKSWIKSFKFARIFDQTDFSGRRVGLSYLLKDKDVVELHVS
ncbi:MAG: GTPase [Candidatus Aenigmatarchaeota archaeon]